MKPGIALLLLLASPSLPQVSQLAQMDVSFRKFVLANGLTLIVHEDHKAPVIAVNVSYHVGSKDDKPGKTGLAHLAEHLMFTGSEHAPGSYLERLRSAGATNLNGSTDPDRTSYYETVPSSAIDYALFLESDRMGHLLEAIDQKMLDLQRGVIQNENRQTQDSPYGGVLGLITASCLPPGHPYFKAEGDSDDLNAISLDDVKNWFTAYYRPNNAVLTLAGDLDPKTAFEKVTHYFGEIPPGSPLSHDKAWVAKRTGEIVKITQDRSRQARIYKLWNVPQYGAKDWDYLQLASSILAGGRASRLYERLVSHDAVASDVSSVLTTGESGGVFGLIATAPNGKDLRKIERPLDEELRRMLEAGPTPDELEQAKAQHFAAFARRLEVIGGSGGKADQLALNETFFGRPDAFKDRLERVGAATPEDLRIALRTWISDGSCSVEVRPFGEFQTAAAIDRSKLPALPEPSGQTMPILRRATLSDGLKLIVAQRRSAPLVELMFQFSAGNAADRFAEPGTANLVSSVMAQATKSRNGVRLAADLTRLGAEVSATSERDTSTLRFSVPRYNLDNSLEVIADVLLHPAFDPSDVELQRRRALAAVQQEVAEPSAVATRMLRRMLYGIRHPYGTPANGFESSLTRITTNNLIDFYEKWYRPNNGWLIVVGDVSVDELAPKLEKVLAGWEAQNPPIKQLPAVDRKRQSAVYVLDRPGALQSYIAVGRLEPDRTNPLEYAVEVLIEVFCGGFSSRVNMNLRENKHWSYGASGRLTSTAADRALVLNTAVQADRTAEAMQEIQNEFLAIAGDRPATDEEVLAAKSRLTLTLGGRYETSRAAATAVGRLALFALQDDYYSTYSAEIRKVSVDEVNRAAASFLRPDALIWVVAGDTSKILAPIRNLRLGDVKVLQPE